MTIGSMKTVKTFFFTFPEETLRKLLYNDKKLFFVDFYWFLLICLSDFYCLSELFFVCRIFIDFLLVETVRTEENWFLLIFLSDTNLLRVETVRQRRKNYWSLRRSILSVASEQIKRHREDEDIKLSLSRLSARCNLETEIDGVEKKFRDSANFRLFAKKTGDSV